MSALSRVCHQESGRNCGYQWAYQDLPELSTDFQLSLQDLQPEAQGHAIGFGENCVYADGTYIFIPMETDFNATLQVADLADEPALGEWVVKVLQVIENIPPDQINGPRPGRVGITFESNGERQGVGFYIDQYCALPAGHQPCRDLPNLEIPSMTLWSPGACSWIYTQNINSRCSWRPF